MPRKATKYLHELSIKYYVVYVVSYLMFGRFKYVPDSYRIFMQKFIPAFEVYPRFPDLDLRCIGVPMF